MREAFIAYRGTGIDKQEIEEALAEANHDYDCTVKVLDAHTDDPDDDADEASQNARAHAVFGKIVLDSYAQHNRDPEVGNGILSVGGYDLSLLHDAAKQMGGGRYDPKDRDSDHRIVRLAFGDFGVDAFRLLDRYMPYACAFFDLKTGELVAGCGRTVGEGQSFANLFYGNPGRSESDIMFGNDAELLSRFCPDIYPVAECSYFARGTFTHFGEDVAERTDAAAIKGDYANARGIIQMIDGMLRQSAEGRLATNMDRVFDEYFESADPRARVSEFVDAHLEDELVRKVGDLINERLDVLCTAQDVDRHLEDEYRRVFDSFLKRTATPSVNIIKLGDTEIGRTDCAFFHQKFEQVLTQVQLDEPVMLIGPAGSGKNYAVAQVAQALNLPMHYTNNASNEFKLTGFIDAGGTYRSTEFYEAFKNGGIFFLDEIDDSDPSALIVINSALANGYMAFPHETIERHPDFRCIAAANTWGKGGNLEYVGRNVIDAATLDRFDMVFFDYDRRLERALYPSDELLQFMWAFRDSVSACRIPHIVSTRSICKCYRKQEYGMDTETILRTNVIRGLSQDDLNVIIGHLEGLDESNRYYRAIVAMRIER